MDEKIEFGTDGIRGKAGIFPFTPHTLVKLGYAIAIWSIEKYGKRQEIDSPKVLLGHDTRISCDEIKKYLCNGLSAAKLSITDAGVLPTPAVLQVLQNPSLGEFGIVISASHNPYTDNGIKLFDGKTGKLSKADEESIVRNFEGINEALEEVIALPPRGAIRFSPDIRDIYVQNTIQHFEPNLLKGIRIVLDCANGATCDVAPRIMSALGADVISINTRPDGKNINKDCGALHPEQVGKEVRRKKAHMGFAFDGDGDRVIAVNKNGQIKDGDDLLALLLHHNDYKATNTIVGTIMTNYGFEDFLKKQNKTLVRTKVGDKYVGAHLEENNLLIGGEASGHIILRNYLSTGDGIFVAIKVLESIIHANSGWENNTFEKTPQTLINIPVTQKKPLDQDPCSEIIDRYTKKLVNGRIVVRYSGTENVLRVMVEDQTNRSAKTIAKNLSNDLQKALR